MKKQIIQIKRKAALLCLFITLLSVSCTKDFERINTNPYEATLEQQLPDDFITGRNFPGMINAVLPAGDVPGATNFVNSYQLAFNLAADCYSGFMGQAGDWSGNNNNLTYGFIGSWINEQFLLTGKLMSAWTKLRDITKVSGDSLSFSVAQIIKVTGIIRATDSYGPIPYSAIPTGTATPAFDSQESIYNASFTDLVNARNILYNLGGTNISKSLGVYDLIYAGDYKKWAKYANSLILRLAIRIVYADPGKAKQYAEEAVNHPAGMISTPDESALQSIKNGNGAFYFTNPLRTLTGAEGGGYKEARAGASMQSILSGYKDPRLNAYFKNATITGRTNEVVGVRTGIAADRALYQPFSELNVTNTTPMPWMRASEVYFLKAEGALRGWNMGGAVKDLYETGIRTSFSETGTAMPAGYLTDAVSKPVNYTDYAKPQYNITAQETSTIQWNDADNFETKLNKLMVQKWIALYLNGPEAWAEFRRTGYPKIFPVAVNNNSGTVNTAAQVRRLPYPIAQYNQNADQVMKGTTLLIGEAFKAASAKGDNGGTRVWWDKNPLTP